MSFDRASRPFDLIVFGATGFTGKLVVSYISSHPQPPKRWAIAGRSKQKLEEIRSDLNLSEEIEILTAKSDDEESLRNLCKNSRVIMSTVGPYLKYGEPLFKACAETGTHYLDLTGEAPWLALMISRYENQAKSTGAIMMPSSGFDSIPSDLGCYLAIRSLRSIAPDSQVSRVRSLFTAKGGISAGTFESIVGIITASKKIPKEEITLSKARGYKLSSIAGKKPKFTLAEKFENNTWGGFWLMAPHNTLIVRRTWSLFESWKNSGQNVSNYGPDFDYDEFFRVPIKSRIVATIWTIGWLVGLAIFASLPPIRWLSKKLLISGKGPSETAQESGWYNVSTTAESSDGKHFGKCKFKAKGDPGYKSTSHLISEVALLLVHSYDELPDYIRQGGVFTPASAGGILLAERLKKTDTTWVTIETDCGSYGKTD